MNRWERLAAMPPAEEAMLHFESADDPLDDADLICDGCKEDWPCAFQRGARSVADAAGLDVDRLARALGQGIEPIEAYRRMAEAVADEYAALAGPLPTADDVLGILRPPPVPETKL